jgi:hypothetical protein
MGGGGTFLDTENILKSGPVHSVAWRFHEGLVEIKLLSCIC